MMRFENLRQRIRTAAERTNDEAAAQELRTVADCEDWRLAAFARSEEGREVCQGSVRRLLRLIADSR